MCVLELITEYAVLNESPMPKVLEALVADDYVVTACEERDPIAVRLSHAQMAIYMNRIEAARPLIQRPPSWQMPPSPHGLHLLVPQTIAQHASPISASHGVVVV